MANAPVPAGGWAGRPADLEESVSAMFVRLFPAAHSREALVKLVRNLDETEFIMTRGDLVHAFSSSDESMIERVTSLFDACPKLVLSKVKKDIAPHLKVSAERRGGAAKGAVPAPAAPAVPEKPSPQLAALHSTGLPADFRQLPPHMKRLLAPFAQHPLDLMDNEDQDPAFREKPLPQLAALHATGLPADFRQLPPHMKQLLAPFAQFDLMDNEDEDSTEAGAPSKAAATSGMASASSSNGLGSKFEQAEAAHAQLTAELEAVLNESNGVGENSVAAASKPKGSAENRAAHDEDIVSELRATGSRKKNKKGALENAEKLEKMIAGFPFVQALELNSPSSVKVLSEWYSKQQVYIVTATELLDLLPEKKEAQERVKKLEKLHKILSEHERLEKQITKELAARRNKDALDNISQQIMKNQASIKKLVQNTKFSTASNASDVMAELKLASSELTLIDEKYQKAQALAEERQAERDSLDKQVANLVKRGYHKASLKHHPDKLGDNITETQTEFWRTIQQALVVLTATESRRDYFDMRDHAKFVALLEKRESGSTANWKKRLTSSMPPKCSRPTLCDEVYGSDDQVAIHLIWSCKNAASLEVTRYDMEVITERAREKQKEVNVGLGTPELMPYSQPEAKLSFREGAYRLRVRAVNVAGNGEWSEWLELVLSGEDNDDARRAAGKLLLKQARERARLEMQEEARVNLASKMSTLASKHSLAFENLTSAVADARKFKLPVTEADYELFARAERKLAELQIEQERRQNLKDWKKKILPFPTASLLAQADSGEIGPNISNMMMQHLTKKAKECVNMKAKAVGPSWLELFDDVNEALQQAQKRSDLFKPNWCMEFQDLGRKLHARIEGIRERNNREQEIYEKKLAEDRAKVAAANSGARSSAEPAAEMQRIDANEVSAAAAKEVQQPNAQDEGTAEGGGMDSYLKRPELLIRDIIWQFEAMTLTQGMSLTDVETEISEQTGRSWKTRYRDKHGSLRNFVKKKPQLFNVHESVVTVVANASWADRPSPESPVSACTPKAEAEEDSLGMLTDLLLKKEPNKIADPAYERAKEQKYSTLPEQQDTGGENQSRFLHMMRPSYPTASAPLMSNIPFAAGMPLPMPPFPYAPPLGMMVLPSGQLGDYAANVMLAQQGSSTLPIPGHFVANAGQNAAAVPAIPDQHSPGGDPRKNDVNVLRTPADAEEYAAFQANMSQAFAEIDLGWPMGMRTEAICTLERGQVMNLMGGGGGVRVGARFADLQRRFPDAEIQLSVEDGMFHNAKIQNFCARFPGINVRIEAVDAVRPDGTRLLVLADMSTNEMPLRVKSCKAAAEVVRLYLSTPPTWNPSSSWCACGKCQTFAGCVGNAAELIQDQKKLSSTTNGGKTDAVAKGDDSLEVEDSNMCNICFERTCDTRMVPCLHKICADCVQLVKESTRLMEQEDECCPFCRSKIKGFIGLRAKFGDANAAKGAKSEGKGLKQEALMQNLKKADACHKCGETGHWASRCPNETLTECFHCGVRGHWASKCPKKGMAKASGAEAKGGGGKPSSSEEGDARVFLPYLPENVSEDMLRSHFGRFGKIVDIFIPHVKSGKEKRIAFITYLTHGEAMACTKNPKHIINNKTCEVVKASPKPGGGKPEAAGAAGAKGGHGGGAKAKGRK